jgi:hypothetical protein
VRVCVETRSHGLTTPTGFLRRCATRALRLVCRASFAAGLFRVHDRMSPVRNSARRCDGSAAVVALLVAFALGVYTGARLSQQGQTRLQPSPPPSLEERGPPSKAELGTAGWTLLHTMAANYAEAPTAQQRRRIEVFLHALGDLYPCPVCAAHFRQHTVEHPIASASRGSLSLWLCEAHNEVNVRNGKEPFYCDLGVLDVPFAAGSNAADPSFEKLTVSVFAIRTHQARWKDCGCGGNHTSGSEGVAAAPGASEPIGAAPQRGGDEGMGRRGRGRGQRRQLLRTARDHLR